MTDAEMDTMSLAGGGSAAVLVVKGLPPQQQLLLVAAANLIGDASSVAPQTPLKGTPSRRLSGFGCLNPITSVGNKVRLAFFAIPPDICLVSNLSILLWTPSLL